MPPMRATDFDPLAPGVSRHVLRLDGAEPQPQLAISIGGRGRGPTILVCGGTHGDEFEGQVAVGDLARALPSLSINGQLIVIPHLHEAACRAGRRTSPADGRDLNRRFGIAPEVRHGPTDAIAAFMERAVLPSVDVVIDLHSGGINYEFVPSSNLQAEVGGPEQEAMLPALLSFDAPFAIVFDEGDENAMPHRGTLELAARRSGAVALSSELGGGGRLTVATLGFARRGLVNLLHHYGVVRSAAAVSWRESRSRLLALCRPEEHLRTPCAGWFCPEVEIAQTVSMGDIVGTLVRDDDPYAEPVAIMSRNAGIVAALAARTRLVQGDVVAFVAQPISA